MARHQRVDLEVIRTIQVERDAAREERDRAVQQLRASRALANRADEDARRLAEEVAEHIKYRNELEKALRKAHETTKWCYLCEAKKHEVDCPLRD